MMDGKSEIIITVFAVVILILAAANVLYFINTNTRTDYWVEGDFGGEEKGLKSLAMAAFLIVALVPLALFSLINAYPGVSRQIGKYVKVAFALSLICLCISFVNSFITFKLGGGAWSEVSLGHSAITYLILLISLVISGLLCIATCKLAVRPRKDSASRLQPAVSPETSLHIASIIPIVLGATLLVLFLIKGREIGFLLALVFGLGPILGGTLQIDGRRSGGILLVILGSLGFLGGLALLLIAHPHDMAKEFPGASVWSMALAFISAGIAVCGVLGIVYCLRIRNAP